MMKIIQILLLVGVISQYVEPFTALAEETSSSISYVDAMGVGWNLGNTFDSYDMEKDSGETTWDNPIVNRELLQAIKAEGFQSIRIPLTLNYRMDSDYVLDEEYMNRYQEVVDWALDVGLYVIINVHHDSKEWLAQWDGNQNSEEFIRFTAIWEQLSERFRDYGHYLSFESINEPYFDEEESKQLEQLAHLNQAFHRIVRESGGNNTERMLILQSLLAKDDQPYLDALLEEIKQLNDPNLIASIHYYGEWEFSNNMGITMIDEPFRQGLTQRQINEDMVSRLKQTFVDNGIGVVIGEYGLLGFDRHPKANNMGETYKFIEHMNHLIRSQPIALFLWDNGQHFNRQTFEWKPEQFGDIVVQSMYNRSAYGTYIDQSFIENIETDLFVSLTHHGMKVEEVLFNGNQIEQGADYDVNQDGLYIHPTFFTAFIDANFESGLVGTLTIRFDEGATWNQDVFLTSEMNFEPITDQTLDQDITIPVDFGGHQVKRISLRNEQGYIQQTDSLLPYLTYLEDYTPDYDNQQLILSHSYLSQLDVEYFEMVIETFDNHSHTYGITIEQGKVQGYSTQD